MTTSLPGQVDTMPPVRAGENRTAHSPLLPHIYTADTLEKMDLPPLRWFIPGLIPEGVTILAGRNKTGKSVLLQCIAIGVAHGNKVLGTIDLDGPQDVLFLALEDNPRRMKRRGDCLQTKLPPNLHIAHEWPRGDEAITALKAFLDAHPSVRFVIIDIWPLIRPLRHGLRRNEYEEVYADLVPLRQLAGERGLAIVLVMHAGKRDSEEGGDWTAAILGSVGIPGASDTVALLTRPRGQTRALLQIGGREHDSELEIALGRDPYTGYGWVVIGGGTAAVLPGWQRKVLDSLSPSGEEMTLAEIYTACQALTESEKAEIRRALNFLVDKGLAGKGEVRGSYFRIQERVTTVT